jgi:hypothetical protein
VDAFVLLKFLAILIMPPAVLAVGVVLALLLAVARRRRLSRIVLGLAIAYILALQEIVALNLDFRRLRLEP